MYTSFIFHNLCVYFLYRVDSNQSEEINQKLRENYISSFKPWYGLTTSCLQWNDSLLNKLFTSFLSYICNYPGVSESNIMQHFSGYIQLKQLREILQCLIDSGYIKRYSLAGRTVANKVTLFSRQCDNCVILKRGT